MNKIRLYLWAFSLAIFIADNALASPPQTNWINPQNLSSVVGGPFKSYFTSKPKIVISQDGSHAIAVWLWYFGNNPYVQSSTAVLSGDNVTWGPVYNIGPWSDSSSIFNPDIAISSDGSKATAVWSTANMILSASATINGNMAAWSDTGGLLSAYQIGAGDSGAKIGLSSDGGKAVAVWKVGPRLYSAAASITGNAASWSPSSEFNISSGNFDIKLSSDGSRVIALWAMNYKSSTNPTGMNYIKSAIGSVSGSGIEWAADENISSSNMASGLSPRIVMSLDGKKVTALWVFDQPISLNTPPLIMLQSASALISGNTALWGITNTVLTKNSSTILFTDIALSAEGEIASIVWYDGLVDLLQSSTATIVGNQAAWGAVVDIQSFQPNESFNPQVRISADGKHAMVLSLAKLNNTSVYTNLITFSSSISGNMAAWGEYSVIPKYQQEASGILVETIPQYGDFDLSPAGNLAVEISLERFFDSIEYPYPSSVYFEKYTTASAIILKISDFFVLNVTKSGSGTVSSNPAGVNCGSDCSENYNSGTNVTLTPTADSGWQFSGWGGACSGTGSCVVAMSAAKSVTASFTQTVSSYPLTVSKYGNGTVTSSPTGINCGTDCSETYNGGTTVTLTATPASGWQFSGWGGACSGTGSCVVAMSAAESVTASFQEVQSTKYNLYSYTAFTGFINNGSAGINYSPGGTDCGLNCDSYNSGTIVTLNAYSTGYTFTGWSGDCWGANPCVLTMDLDHTVTANFSATLSRTLSVTKTGNGTISSLSPNTSIYCGTACQGSFSDGQFVTLFAQPDKGHTFMGWTGSAAGTCGRQTTCSVYMSSNQSISADFKNTYVLIQPAIQLLLLD